VPYITNAERQLVASEGAQTPGQLNYELTMVVLRYMRSKGPALRYATINDVLGALEGAKLEFYRRVASPYESIKAAENGDVYP
jgi:hypothetical protein